MFAIKRAFFMDFHCKNVFFEIYKFQVPAFLSFDLVSREIVGEFTAFLSFDLVSRESAGAFTAFLRLHLVSRESLG